MAVPSEKKQIERVAEFLEDPANDERSVEEVAEIIVSGMYDMWERGVTSPPMLLKVGQAFKSPMSSKTYFVAHEGDMYWNKDVGVVPTLWVVDSSSEYGMLMPVDRPYWRIVKPSNAKAGAPGTNDDGWKVGDKVSLSQRKTHYEIIAVGLKTVLMHAKGAPTMWFAEGNSNLKRYYSKEVSLDWGK